MTESTESRFELRFLDGPGEGKTLNVEVGPPKVVWLCGDGNRKWWTFSEPAFRFVEAEYKIEGFAPRRGERYLILYGVKEPDA